MAVSMKLAKAWTYRTPETTIDFGEGEHSVAAAIRDAARAAGVLEEIADNERGPVHPEPPQGDGAVEGEQ